MPLPSYVKRVVLVLLVIWLATSLYLWFPDILGFMKKSKASDGKKMESKQQKIDHVISRLGSSNESITHVCITSDKNTLGGMMTLINSIHTNTKHPVIYHLLTDEESFNHAKAWIAGTKLKDIDYKLKVFPEDFVNGKINMRGTRKELGRPLNYARYYLPQLFPGIKDRLVFIDDDCIVQGDIREIFKMKLKPGTWGAFSEDCSGPSKRLSHRQNVMADFIDFKNKHVKLMDIKPQTCSFNTGVYLADIKLWKKNNITQQLEYWLELNSKEEVYGNEKAGGGSGPPMMLVFSGKYSSIDPNWHVRNLGITAGTSYSKQFLKQAKLLHWNGVFKPWGRISSHTELWDKYYVPDPIGKFRPVRKNMKPLQKVQS